MKIFTHSYLLSLLLLLGSYSIIQAQNLEDFDRTNPLKLSGTFSAGTTVYQAFGIENRRSPLSYFVSANPVISIYGFDIPISFTYRDQQGSISNPFQRYSINPSWRWISAHAGNVSLELHPYVYSGQVIKGGALELTPGKFRFAAAYGELENPLAQLDTIVAGAVLLETYKRDAATLKVGIGGQKSFFELTALRAKDRIEPGDIGDINTELVKAAENVALGSAFQLSLFNHLVIASNVAASAITPDQSAFGAFVAESGDPNLQRLNDLFTVNISTRLQVAGDVRADLKFKHFSIGGEYKRVDPQYKSLGTFYFQEDFENITLRLQFSVFGGRLRFNGNGGQQRNNLNKLRSYTNKRTIGNGSLTIIPTNWMTFVANYANYQTDRTPGFFNVNDTVRYAQTTAIQGGTLRFLLAKKNPTTLTFAGNYQQLQDVLSNEDLNRNIDNYTGNVNFSKQFKGSQFGFTVAALGVENQFYDRTTQRFGINTNINKKLMDRRLSLRFGGGYALNYLNYQEDGYSITSRIDLKYRVKGKYQITFRANYLQRRGGIESFEEVRGSTKFSYQFKPKKINSKK